jgi:hypothetical protein
MPPKPLEMRAYFPASEAELPMEATIGFVMWIKEMG